jgi:DNA-binding GntR family transcriptional regulator
MTAALRLTDPIAPQLFTLLRRSIAELRLPPGSALSEKEIAASYGVSRQPVREAFIKLSEAGLVEIRPSRGTFVVKISVREVANARLVREAIETEIARHAARLATPHQLDALRDLIGRQKAAAAAGDYAGFNAFDEGFHRALGDIVQNDFALRIVEAARFQTDRVRLLSLPDASPLNVLIDQHEAILAGLVARDEEAAARAMSRHLREILIALPSIAAAHPEFFDDTTLPAHSRDLAPETGTG